MRQDGIRAKAAAATREAIVDTARRLFSQHGYNAVSIDRIVMESNVTRGALYHHFIDKRSVFLEVFHAVEIELSARAVPEPPANEPAGPWRRYRLRIQSFLDAILQENVHQVLLIDGPQVLGWAEWRRHESEYGLGAISSALSRAIAAGCISPQPVTPLAHIILAAINETALLIVNASDLPAMRREAGQALDRFLAGLES